MADKKYVISETGEFPPQYKVLRLDDDGIYRPVFGPDPDLSDSERKCAEMNVDRAGNDGIADDPSTTDVNVMLLELPVGGKKAKKASAGKKAPTKKKVRARKKVRSKKAVAKKKTAKKTAKKR